MKPWVSITLEHDFCMEAAEEAIYGKPKIFNTDRIYLIILKTVKETKIAVNEYMNFYNCHRMYQAL